MKTASKIVSPSRALLPRLGGLLAAIVLLMVMLAPAQAQETIPTMSINSVVTDTSVTFTTYNFPPNQDFVLTMGKMGTLGIDGWVLDTINSGAGGSATYTYPIPDAFLGDYQISIRMQSAQGYYAYNWFYNNTSGTPGTTPPPSDGYTGIPTFSIVSVNADQDVTILTNNFPANQSFTVTIGEMGTLGIGGIVVGTIESGAGGAIQQTFSIPAELYGRSQLSIRAQTAHAAPYYAYNWFYNSTNGEGGQPTTPPPSDGYTGYPTFGICSVQANSSVEISPSNFPPNQTFNVTMGAMGTLGVGTAAGTATTDANGVLNATTFTIPTELNGYSQISIRLQTSHANPYYAYNWFYNNTADVCP